MRRPKSFILFLCLVSAFIGYGAAQAGTGDRHEVEIVVERVCAEDEPFLQGRGDFDGQVWARYECLHVDEVQVG